MAINSATTPPKRTVKLKTTPRVKVDPPTSDVESQMPTGAGTSVESAAGEPVRKSDFIDRVVARSGVKKRDAKPAIEAALAELADLLASGQDMNLPPMGKIKSVKSKDIGDGAKALTLKLRTMKNGAGQGADLSDDKTGVAEPEKDD